jgi:predicted porin
MIAIACAHENALRWQVWGLVSWGETLLMKKSGMAVAMFAAGVMFGPNGALAADVNLVTKAPPLVTPAMPATCTGVSQFFLTDCVLSWYGISVYGAVDVGGGYQTHGAPFNGYFPQGASYSSQKMNRQAMWGLAPGGLSASNIGVRGAESIGGDWKAIFQVEAGFDPYSLRLSNGGNALFGNLGVPLNQQSVNADSSRGGQFYNSVGFVGVSSPTYGTLTFFRQNSLTLDGLAAYDPLALSYAFSQIGFQSVATGAGITETARASTSVKYRYQYGDFRAGVLYQFGGYDLNNGANSAVQLQLGGDVRHLGPGTLSVDGIFSYEKDAAALALGGGATNVNGVPITFPGQTVTATISNNTAWVGLAKYVVGRLGIYAGYEYIDFAPPSDVPNSLEAANGTWVGAGYPLTAISGTAYSGLPGSGSDKHLQIMWIGAKYSVTDNLDVATGYYHYIQNDYLVATGAANCALSSASHSQCGGTLDAISGVVDWRFAAKWDTYFGIMYSNVNGGLSNGYLVRNNLDPTVGLRFRF